MFCCLNRSFTNRGPVDLDMEINSRDKPITPSIPDYETLLETTYIAILIRVSNEFEFIDLKIGGPLDQRHLVSCYKAVHIVVLSQVILNKY